MKILLVSLAVGVVATILVSTISAHYITFDEISGGQLKMTGLDATKHYIGMYGFTGYLYSLRASFLVNILICYVSGFLSVKLVVRGLGVTNT